MDVLQLSLLQPGWQDRMRFKLASAVALSGVGTAYSAARHGRDIWREVPQKVLGYSASMAVFCGVQESLRALRGRNDALNSLAAGAITGGLMAGVYQGPKFRLLGAVLWGPLCGALHVANDVLHPGRWMEDAFIDNGLLSPTVRERRLEDRAPPPAPLVGAAAPLAGGSAMEDFALEAQRIKAAEMEALRLRMDGPAGMRHSPARPTAPRPAPSAQSSASSASTSHRQASDSASSSSSGGAAPQPGGGSGETAGGPPAGGRWWLPWRRSAPAAAASGTHPHGSESHGGDGRAETASATGQQQGGDTERGQEGTDAAEDAEFQRWLDDPASLTADSIWAEVGIQASLMQGGKG